VQPIFRYRSPGRLAYSSATGGTLFNGRIQTKWRGRTRTTRRGKRCRKTDSPPPHHRAMPPSICRTARRGAAAKKRRLGRYPAEGEKPPLSPTRARDCLCCRGMHETPRAHDAGCARVVAGTGHVRVHVPSRSAPRPRTCVDCGGERRAPTASDCILNFLSDWFGCWKEKKMPYCGP
jgi:hypothetical protein